MIHDVPSGTYADLKQRMQAAGLLHKHPQYLLTRIAVNIVMLVLGVIVLYSAHRFLWQLLDAVYLAFVSVQISFIIHDTGHRQAFHSTRMNNLVGMLHGNLLWGGCYRWWVEVHNDHHSHPNEPGADPHIDLPMLAFSQEEALAKRGIYRWLVRYQAYYVFPSMLFLMLSQTNDGLRYLWNQRWPERRLEIVLLLVHAVAYLTMLFTAMTPWHAVLFLLVHRGVTGLYAGSIFAPNHKGMPLMAPGQEISFLEQQILTARNIRGGWLITIWYGGLNYQIEHHLFPTVARNNLPAAQTIIRVFCDTYGIDYYETSMLRCYQEVCQSLHAASAPLRHGPDLPLGVAS